MSRGPSGPRSSRRLLVLPWPSSPSASRSQHSGRYVWGMSHSCSWSRGTAGLVVKGGVRDCPSCDHRRSSQGQADVHPLRLPRLRFQTESKILLWTSIPILFTQAAEYSLILASVSRRPFSLPFLVAQNSSLTCPWMVSDAR